jgi:hypothetical protein
MAIEIEVKITDETREKIRALAREAVREELDRLPLGTVLYTYPTRRTYETTPAWDALLDSVSYWSK